MKNPFFFASNQLFLNVARNLEQFGLPRVRMDVIFDNRVMEKDKFIAGWEWASKATMPDPPDLLTGILLNAPYFQDDKDVLPLQAADMHATYVRLSFEAAIKGHEPCKIPGFTKLLRGMLMTWDKDQFRQQAESDIRHMRKRGLL